MHSKEGAFIQIPKDHKKHPTKHRNGQDQKAVLDENGNYDVYESGDTFGEANEFLHDNTSALLGTKGTIDKSQYIDKPFWTVDIAYYIRIFEDFSTCYFPHLCTTTNFDLYKYGSAILSKI